MRFLATTGLVLTAIAACAQVDPNRTVLVLNGEEIKGSEYFKRMEFLPGVGKVLESGRVVVYPPGFLTLVQLIDQHLVLQLAKKKGLLPTDVEVSETIKESEADDPTFEQKWQNSGRTMEELTDAVRIQVAEFKLQTAGITITDQQVIDAYHKKAQPEMTVIPRKVQLRVIAVREEADEKTVDGELSSGKSFADVAKAHSADVTQDQGGEIGVVPTDAMPRSVVAAIDTTKIGQATGWVEEKDRNGAAVAYVKYLIEDKTPEKEVPFSDALKNRMRRKMMMDRGHDDGKDQQLGTELSDLRKASTIDIDDPEFAKMYGQFMQTYFQEKVKVGQAASAAPSQIDPNRVVLVLNGEKIKGDEYYQRMEFLPGVGRVLESGRVVVYPPGLLTLVQLIDEHLVLQLASKKGLTPTDAEVEDAIKEAQADDPAFQQRWLNGGRTMSDLKHAILLQVAQFKLQTAGVSISDQQVKDAYRNKEVPDLTVVPRSVKLRAVAVRDGAAQKAVEDELAKGKNFADVAKAHSIDATKDQGGDIGTVPVSDLPKPILDAVGTTKVGQTTGWVEQKDRSGNTTAYVKYLVENETQEKDVPLTDALKNRIRRKLMVDRGVVANKSLFTELSELRKSSSIDIKDKEFAKMYAKFMQAYFQQTVKAGG